MLTKKEQAKIILEAMETYIQIDHNFEKYYIEGIVNGLVAIEKAKEEE